MTCLVSCLRRLVADHTGVTAMEYGVIAAAIVVTGLATLPSLTTGLSNTLNAIAAQL